MLELIARELMAKGLVTPTWAGDMETRGQLVKLFREYHDGQHRMQLTTEMRKMMRIDDARLDRFNSNYCEMVISSMADRLGVDTIQASSGLGGAALELADFLAQQLPEGVNAQTLAQTLISTFGMGAQMGADDPGQQWVDAVLEANRFDGLQIKLREAVLRDGDTFLMVEYNDDTGLPELSHEPTWDGDSGSLVIYDRRGKTIVAGVKIWYEGEMRRANIYWPDHVDKYLYEMVEVVGEGQVTREEPQLKAYKDNPVDTTRDGKAPGVPLIHFANKGGVRGSSELLNVIPLQDALNRTLISMVMSAELSAFSILFAKGWKPPAAILPGMILHTEVIGPDGQTIVTEDKDTAAAIAALIEARSLERIEAGDLQQLISEAEWLIAQIGTISSTPVPSMMGGDAESGEALKQRDVRLLGKLNRAMVQIGNSWEDAFAQAHRQQRLFGQGAPVIVRFTLRWKSAEIRNDDALRALAELFFKHGYDRAALRVISQTSTANYTEADIDRLMREKSEDANAGLENLNVPALAF